MSLSLALVFPMVLLVVWLTVQGAFWWYDRQVALGAARQGSEVASSATPAGLPGDGTQEARAWMQANAGGGKDMDLQSWQTVNGDTVTVYAHLKAQSILLGFFPLSITVHVSAPLEKFAPAGP
ncbi:hypothetical protein ABIA32_003174 [Streptacidiphilus sp. MAP12-20]|uniref:TadE family protein n=1 Tax=Streptacidiphilus sp. MAP12-20 TaxID=3156299 RepID=UPI003512F666